jgi:iron complex outermembrane receptor protein
LALLVAVFVVAPLVAAQSAGTPAPTAQGQQAQPAQPADQQKPAQKPAEEQKPITYEETVIVTASRVEQMLINAPLTMSVIDARVLASSPAQNYGDLLRAVPGVNVSQMSARDINVTSRGATSSLSTGQLALVDGRSIYQDFFGFVAWDFLPINFGEVKQIEVIRGPASAVWGANALYGVVNVITKTPREMKGASFSMGVGTFNRNTKDTTMDNGTQFYINGSWADAPNDKWSYKISAGAFTMDPLARPTGTINNSFKTPYPSYENQGTAQPKFDVRVDYDGENNQRFVFAGGLAGTDGIMQSGIGPFDIQKGSVLGYFKTNYSRGGLKVNFFTNILDGNAPNLLAIGANGKPIELVFKNNTYDFEFGNVQAAGTRNVFSYGGNIRHNGFDLSIAPGEDARNEGGMYVQDEAFLHEKFRAVLGARVDWFDVLDGAVVSPRIAFVFKPLHDQSIRLSYNRAYRAPSMINNYLGVTIIQQIDLGAISPALAGRKYNFPVAASGNPNLTKVTLDAYELGYTGGIKDKATVTAAIYFNNIRDDIFFTQSAAYSSRKPPPGWPLPPVVLDLMNAAGSGLPSNYTYLNFGRTKQWGLELGFNATINPSFRTYVNYSYQPTPDVNFDESEINQAPKNRFNLGLSGDNGRFFGSFDVNYTDEAFWQDVLDARYAGFTDAWTGVNVALGARFMQENLSAAVKINNIANRYIQQHIFGDVLKRQFVFELRAGF